MLDYYNSPKYKRNLRRSDQDRPLPTEITRRQIYVCVVCYKQTCGQSPFFCTFLDTGGLQIHYKTIHNDADLYGQTRKSNMRQLIFPENPNNSMIPLVKIILSGEVYYLATTSQMFNHAIGQRALTDVRGDLIPF
jgi:hypothetical protein